MFAEKIGESVSTTGTGTFSLTQTAYGAFRTWRSGFATGTAAWYLATNDTGTIWEIGYGTFTTGSPDTLTRTLVASSSGALINWATTPYRVYSIPTGTALAHMLAPLVNGVANVPGWLPAGALWLDYTLGLAVAWIKKRYISGTRTTAANHAEEGRFHLASGTNFFAASQRALFVDKGAASYTFTADDIGKVLAFDCTASARTLTMLVNSAAGMGHGAYVFVYPYGSTVNGVTFTPGGADTTDLATAPAGRITKFQWDGARSKWVADYTPNATTQSQADNSVKQATTAYADRVGVQQIQEQATSAVATGTTLLPLDDTIPQNTEGDQYLTVSITPKSATSTLVIDVQFNYAHSTNDSIQVALFKDSTADALVAAVNWIGLADVMGQVKLQHKMTSGGTSAITFKVRAGPNSGGTLTFNGTSAARRLGGVMNSYIRVKEIGI